MPIVNSSITSRAKFSCGVPRTLSRPSSHTSIAGSRATDTSRSWKLPSALALNFSIWPGGLLVGAL